MVKNDPCLCELLARVVDFVDRKMDEVHGKFRIFTAFTYEIFGSFPEIHRKSRFHKICYNIWLKNI